VAKNDATTSPLRPLRGEAARDKKQKISVELYPALLADIAGEPAAT
jgi:hypothetical protein